MNIVLPIILLSIAFMIPHLEAVNVNSSDKGQVFVEEMVSQFARRQRRHQSQ